MDYSVCSREFERDYTWDNSHASRSVAKYAQDILAPAFEGSLTTSRFVALLRSPVTPSGTLLGVSVSTSRQDFRHRPIRTMAFLCAATKEETELLAAFFSECLRNKDEDTIYNADSPAARAVESLYQNKNPDEFAKYCRSLHSVKGGKANLSGQRVIPRNDANSRNGVAESLSTLVDDGSPFLVVLTDRMPDDVLASLGTMFDRRVVRIFSNEVIHEDAIMMSAPRAKEGRSDFHQSSFPFNRTGAKIAAAAAVAMVIWAIVPSCSKKESMPSQKIAEESQETQSCTNLPPKAVKSCETNSAACLSDSAMTGKNK